VILLRALSGEDWAEWRALRLAALGEAPQAFSATLADWQGEADTEARWRLRLEGGSLDLVAEVDGTPAGMVSGMPSGRDGTVKLVSLWVAPFARGRGVGDELVAAVLRWAWERHAGRVVLRTFDGNHAAARLYRRHGFVDTGPAGDAFAQREMVCQGPVPGR
jgi:RimJ/RimL family protein N-acetyltransferase